MINGRIYAQGIKIYLQVKWTRRIDISSQRSNQIR